MHASLFEDGFGLLSRKIVKSSVHPGHPLIDFVGPMGVAEETAKYRTAAFSTIRESAYYAHAGGIDLSMLCALRIVDKQLTAIGAELEFRLHSFFTSRAEKWIVTGVCHGCPQLQSGKLPNRRGSRAAA
jgi:hypothetical protein